MNFHFLDSLEEENMAKLLKDRCFPMDNRKLNLKLKKMKSSSIDCMMNYYYNDINAYVCPIPFIMSKHLYINYNKFY